MADLTLDTEFPRTTVHIAGSDYQMIHPREMPLGRMRKLEAKRRQLNTLLAMEEPSDEEEQQLEGIFVAILRAIMPQLPDDVARTIPDSEKLRALEHFSAATPKIKPEAEPQRTEYPATSDHGSNGSTEQPIP